MSRFPLFDRDRLQLRDLAERGHGLHWTECLPLQPLERAYGHPELGELVARIVTARQNGRPVVLIMGGHPIKLGLSRFLVDLIENRIITHLATNGAGIIHDFELALVGGTSEDVAKWIRAGQFGLWKETARLNNVIYDGAERDEGLGEAVGRHIEEREFPHRDLSLAAAGWRTGIPVTSHVNIGCDIIHSLANCDGAALGKTSYTDFLIFTQSLLDLEGGVFLNVGTAVTGPEVFLKALSMVRNVARQEGQEIRRFTTAVFDLNPLPANFRQRTPSKDHPEYYDRPWKTILVRTVADGGESYFFEGDHRRTIPTLWTRLVEGGVLVRSPVA
jgi:hypothetical protein